MLPLLRLLFGTVTFTELVELIPEAPVQRIKIV